MNFFRERLKLEADEAISDESSFAKVYRLHSSVHFSYGSVTVSHVIAELYYLQHGTKFSQKKVIII